MASTPKQTPKGTQPTSSTNSDVSVDDIAAQLDMLKEDVATLTRTMKLFSRQTSERVVDDTKDTMRRALSKSEDQVQALRAAIDTLPDEAATAVRNRPMTSLGLAMGLGILLGLASGRK